MTTDRDHYDLPQAAHLWALGRRRSRVWERALDARIRVLGFSPIFLAIVLAKADAGLYNPELALIQSELRYHASVEHWTLPAPCAPT